MYMFLVYLLESSVCLSLFFCVFWTLMRNDTCFKFNRFALLSIMSLALVLPLIPSVKLLDFSKSGNYTIQKINHFKNEYKQFPEINRFSNLKNRETGPVIKDTASTEDNKLPGRQTLLIRDTENMIDQSIVSTGISQVNIFVVAYFIVTGFFFLRFIFSTRKLILLKKRNNIYKHDDIFIVEHTCNYSAFSFFRTIFINKTNLTVANIENIIAHEKIHIKQRHSIDSILMELLTAVFWFNPVIWMIRKSLKITHEYLADNGVITLGHNIYNYQILLLETILSTEAFAPTNSFNYGSLKRRIMMMTKIKSHNLGKLKTLFLFPFIFILIAYFSFPVGAMVYEDFPNGVRKFEANFSNDLLNGRCRAWDENGDIKYKMSFRNGEADGVFEYYDYEGLDYEFTVKNGELDGIFRGYSESGQLIEEGFFNEYHTGTWRIWSENGEPHIIMDWVNNKIHGKFIVYYLNSTQVMLEMSFVENRVQNKFTIWHENGSKATSGTFVDGLFYQNNDMSGYSGPAIAKFANGTTSFNASFKNGKLEGNMRIKYFSNNFKFSSNIHISPGQGDWWESFKNGTYRVIDKMKDQAGNIKK